MKPAMAGFAPGTLFFQAGMKEAARKLGSGCRFAAATLVVLLFASAWGLIAWSLLDEDAKPAADAASAAADPLLRRPLVSTAGRIAFTVQHGDGEDIYIVGSGGAGLKRLIRLRGFLDSELSWAPDGTRLAFTSDDDAFILEIDGANGMVRRIVRERRAVRRIWSPDGRLAVLAPVGRTDDWGLAITNGDSARDITRGWPVAGADGRTTSVVWSSDGQRIAFIRGVLRYANEAVKLEPRSSEDIALPIELAGMDPSEAVVEAARSVVR